MKDKGAELNVPEFCLEWFICTDNISVLGLTSWNPLVVITANLLALTY